MPSNTFCVLPWYSEEIKNQRKTACCLLPDDHDIEKIKSDLLSGVRSDSCQKCWTIEDQKQDSRRIQENRFLDWKLDRDIENIQDDCANGRAQPLMYQIYLSSLCNQACVTCNSSSSTKWAEVEKKMNIIPAKPYYMELDDLKIDFKTVQRINLLGGEPMFDPRSFQLLKKLLDHGNDRCFISFVTNGSVNLSDPQRDLLREFPNLNICFSVDGIGKRFEYMRWPGKWNDLLDNLDQYNTITDNFSVSYTISAVNAIYYDETVEWFEKQNLRFNHNIVYGPIWAALPTMPKEIKQHLRHSDFFRPFTEITESEISTKDFLDNLRKQDIAKNIALRDHMPELLAIIQ
jgi:hypothetical protein